MLHSTGLNIYRLGNFNVFLLQVTCNNNISSYLLLQPNCKKVGMNIVQNNQYKPHNLFDNVVLENRKAVPEIEAYLNNTFDQLKSLDYFIDDIFDAEEVFEVLDEDLPNSSYDANKGYFINDVVRLSELFFKRTKSKKIRLKIEIVKTDMCRLFHVDNYRQRLLCTYKGPGTEWLNNSNVNRKGLGKGCNESIVRNFDKVNKASEFEVLLLRGLKYGRDHLGIVHRSPPIENQSKKRILLKIEELDH